MSAEIRCRCFDSAQSCGCLRARRSQYYSEGAYAAVACHDYPNLWDKQAGFEERREQLAASRAQLAPDAFAPFSVDLWL